MNEIEEEEEEEEEEEVRRAETHLRQRADGQPNHNQAVASILITMRNLCPSRFLSIIILKIIL